MLNNLSSFHYICFISDISKKLLGLIYTSTVFTSLSTISTSNKVLWYFNKVW